MLGLLLIVLFGAWVVYHQQSVAEVKADIPTRLTLDKMDQLWSIAQESLQTNKYHNKKALLTILRIDERNTSAYNRLGILYAKQHSMNDAIECFEIAQSLEPSASSLHNVGLIYYETKKLRQGRASF